MFTHLFTPIAWRGRRARNRIVRLPTTSNLGEKSMVSDAMVENYRRIAKGGVGTIVTEGMAIHPVSLRGERSIAAFDKASVPGMSRLAEAVHQEGALLFGQLIHGGRQHHSTRALPVLWAPSPIACDYSGGVPHPLTTGEIGELIEGFASAARNARSAGLDGVELHGAQGYLLQQFASPVTNKRTDEYGGTFERRMQFILRVVSAVREAIGPDRVLGYRLGVEEFNAAGITIETAIRMAKLLAATAQIDYFSLSQGIFTSIELHLPDRHHPPAAFVPLQAQIKRAIPDVPVVVSGRIVDPAGAEEILAAGDADLVGLCRALTADAEWPRKAEAGLLETIRPCIACNQCWVNSINGEPIRCVVDPAVGTETARLAPANGAGRRITVVGGGPGGLEAARVAAERGATVTILEASTALGGKLVPASTMPAQRELGDLSEYLASAAKRRGVRIRVGETATASGLIAGHPDAVILAAGAEAVSPEVPTDGSIPIVVDPREPMPELPQGANVVILDQDGHNWGAAMAERLASDGYLVTVVTPFFEPFRELSPVSRGHVLAALDGHGVATIPNTRVVGIEAGVINLEHKFSHRRASLKASALFWIGSQRPRDELLPQLREAGIAVHTIGDALAPRRLGSAIAEARRAAIAVTS